MIINCGEFICTEDDLCAIHTIEDVRRKLREARNETQRLLHRHDYFRRETFGDGVWHDAPPLASVEKSCFGL